VCYAASAKNIKTPVKKNEDPAQQRTRELTEENAALKRELELSKQNTITARRPSQLVRRQLYLFAADPAAAAAAAAAATAQEGAPLITGGQSKLTKLDARKLAAKGKLAAQKQEAKGATAEEEPPPVDLTDGPTAVRGNGLSESPRGDLD
jgi:hypothetical protein